MADPVVDEDGIIALLRGAPVRDNVSRLQTGAVQALVDLYDRKVTRQEFLSAASQCLALYASVSRIELLGSIHDVFETGHLSEDSFKVAEEQLQQLIRLQTANVIELVERLKKCPTSKDIVH